MFELRNSGLKPLIDSAHGLHLTVYLSNPGHPSVVKKRLEEMIVRARKYAEPALEPDDLDKFIAPLRQLADNRGLLRSFKNNLGVFRTLDSFRVLNLPIAVQDLCVVATTFHVKPLLRWLQSRGFGTYDALERNLAEYHWAETERLTHSNIFQIAKAAVHGRVHKLIIADGVNIFGKVDPKTGGLAIHPGHMDHEDDDILDDLAQIVLAHGGEVFVAPRHQMPKPHPILAIVKRLPASARRRRKGELPEIRSAAV